MATPHNITKAAFHYLAELASRLVLVPAPEAALRCPGRGELNVTAVSDPEAVPSLRAGDEACPGRQHRRALRLSRVRRRSAARSCRSEVGREPAEAAHSALGPRTEMRRLGRKAADLKEQWICGSIAAMRRPMPRARCLAAHGSAIEGRRYTFSAGDEGRPRRSAQTVPSFRDEAHREILRRSV